MAIPADLQFANEEDLTWAKHIPLPHFVTGSRVCAPEPNLGSDIDIVIMFTSAAEGKAYLELEGFEPELKLHDDYCAHNGRSWRRGDINVIEVWSEEYFLRWALATVTARHLKPPTREQRIALFRAIRDNKYDDLIFLQKNSKIFT